MPTLQHRLIRMTLAAFTGAIRQGEYNIPTLRKFIDLGSSLLFMPAGVETEKFRLGHLQMEWVIPANADHNKVILFFHGGGYAVGSTDTHRSLVAEIARRSGHCALIPEYRLAPEFPFPSALEDAIKSYTWLLETGHDPSDIIVAGDSAGGGLALALMLALRDKGIPQPAGSVLISPWVDLTITQASIRKNIDRSPVLYLREMQVWAKNYAGDYDVTHPLISPLFADLSGLPPMLIQVSDTEVLVDEDLQLAEKAKAAGVDVRLHIWHGLIHVWHIYWRYLKQASDAIDEISDFIGTKESSAKNLEKQTA